MLWIWNLNSSTLLPIVYLLAKDAKSDSENNA